MARNLAEDLEQAEGAIGKGVRRLWIWGVLAFALTRAPGLLKGFSSSGLKLDANVGYLIVLAPFAILAGILVLRTEAARVVTLRRRLFHTELIETLTSTERAAWEIHGERHRVDGSVRPRVLNGWPRAVAILTLPLLLAAFVGQYFTFARPDTAQGECPGAFERTLDLLTTAGDRFGVKPVRCFDQGALYQAQFPWIYPPVQSWLYVLMILVSAKLCLDIHRRLQQALLLPGAGARGPDEVGAEGPEETSPDPDEGEPPDRASGEKPDPTPQTPSTSVKGEKP